MKWLIANVLVVVGRARVAAARRALAASVPCLSASVFKPYRIEWTDFHREM